jgi:NhaP-type Na+/H+ or K+/H+ antiporter
MLYSIVFGESMLNDAISVVLYHTLTNINGHLDISPKSLFSMLGTFLAMSLGTVGIGVFIGLVSS